MGWFAKLIGMQDKKPPIHLTDDNFDAEVLQADIPVVVDFWGEACPPCKQLEPVIMALAARYDGRVKVCEAAVRSNMGAARAFMIRSTPTVLYFRPGGELVERTVGYRAGHYHEQVIDHALLGDAS